MISTSMLKTYNNPHNLNDSVKKSFRCIFQAPFANVRDAFITPLICCILHMHFFTLKWTILFKELELTVFIRISTISLKQF